jgi:D-alanyl-D-alanine carboxypeptidase/D-alanyl-D-alanine-endopeptidase (penicillin-binding protein 4)
MPRFLTFLFCLQNFLFSQNAGLDIILKNNELSSAIIAVSVKDVSDSKAILEHNSYIQLTPASTFKLITTIVALEKLGVNFQFKTEVYYSGKIENKTLNGNLIIKGYGDPTFESRFFKSPSLQEICESLKNKGVEHISGKIIIDNSYFKPEINDNWVWEDINNYYSAIPYPINIYDNEFHIYLQSNEVNSKVQITKIFPQYNKSPKIEITESTLISKPGGDNAYIYGDPLNYSKRINGSIPPFQKDYSIEGALPDPARMFAQELISTFSKNNISFNQQQFPIIINADTLNYSQYHLLFTLKSPPLSEIVRLTNLHSINFFAESMLYALGNGNYENGKKIIMNFLKEKNINTNEINIDDACGLSRLNGISADVMTQLLNLIFNSKNKNIFQNSLPISGESGTMKNFSNSPPLSGNLMCKTGYIQRVRTYAGFLKTKSGKILSVCLMYNNFNTSNEKIKQISKIFFETLYQNF